MLLISLGAPWSAWAGDPLGRLFFTPAERAVMDILRQNSRLPEKPISPDGNPAALEEATEEAAAPPAPISVQGFVKRSDGKGTIWLNGQPVMERSAGRQAAVGKLNPKTGRVTVKLPSGQVVELKAGQTYDPVSGKVLDGVPQPAVEPAAITPESSGQGLPDHAPSTAPSGAAVPSRP